MRTSWAAAWARDVSTATGSMSTALTAPAPSIAAAMLGAGAVSAVDIDPVAVETSRAHAAAHDVRIQASHVDDVAGRYALVVANILATPLKLLAPALVSHLDAGAMLVLSGILESQAGELADAYAPWLVLRVAALDDGWILMTGELPAQHRVA